jgi:uncharacterized protein YjbI with pentapeptide repeats
MSQVDFTKTNITGAIFDQCYLENAIFSETILEKSDFRTAYNFSIDPQENRLQRAKFSKDNLAGLLTKYKIDIS